MKAILMIKEKFVKLLRYIKLEFMFVKKNEFACKHPELKTLWKKKFRQMIRYSSNRVFPIAEEFLTVGIEKVSEAKNSPADSKEPILICALKNDIDKLPYFMEHYRERGIESFVFLDNMSTDGSFEFLMEQADAEVYRCAHPFTADRKIAWVNRLIAEYGMNKWYLMVDSDEFFTYLGEKDHKFADVIDRAELMGYKRLGNVCLDMYPQGELFKTVEKRNFIEEYCYFDTDTYVFKRTNNGMSIKGGPRKRVFGTDMKISGIRMVYFEEDDVVPSAHFMIPFEKSYGAPVCLLNKHYKFVNESDYDKVIEAVKTGMHSNNSEEYKTYYEAIKNNRQISLYDMGHSALFSEENVRQIDFVADMFNA